jgi:hypothetical protein
MTSRTLQASSAVKWLRAMLTIVALAFSASTAMAQDEPFSLECPQGAYLTGFTGKAGDVIDRMSIFCARWNPDRVRLEAPTQDGISRTGGPGVPGFAGQSNGGVDIEAHCPPGWAVGGGYNSDYSTGGKDGLLHHFDFNCYPIGEEKGDVQSLRFGSHSNSEIVYRRGTRRQCNDNQLAYGLVGRDGLFIDEMHLMCRAEPGAIVTTERIEPEIFRDTMVRTNKGNVDDMVATAPAPTTQPPPPPPPAKTAKVRLAVEVFDAPGGNGNKIGELAAEIIVGLIECQADNWCHVNGNNVPNGDGWVYSGPDYQSLEL